MIKEKMKESRYHWKGIRLQGSLIFLPYSSKIYVGIIKYRLIDLHMRAQALLTITILEPEKPICAHIERQSEQERNATAVYTIGQGMVGAPNADIHS